MNKDEFVSIIEDIGFVKKDLLLRGSDCMIEYYGLLNYEIQINFYDVGKIEAYYSINYEKYTFMCYGDLMTDTKLFRELYKLPEIQYTLREKKLNKILKR